VDLLSKPSKLEIEDIDQMIKYLTEYLFEFNRRCIVFLFCVQIKKYALEFLKAYFRLLLNVKLN